MLIKWPFQFILCVFGQDEKKSKTLEKYVSKRCKQWERAEKKRKEEDSSQNANNIIIITGSKHKSSAFNLRVCMCDMLWQRLTGSSHSLSLHTIFLPFYIFGCGCKRYSAYYFFLCFWC